MIFLIVIFFIVIIVLILFSFPRFSPIPYFPSNKKDLKHILKALQLKNNQTVIDLGAGDGIVIFEAAKEALKRKLNTKFIAVEINPVLLCILYLRRLPHPNRKNIRIIFGDMFIMNFSSLTTPYSLPPTFYLYISPWHLEKTVANIKRQLNHFSIVSYMYEIPSLRISKKLKGNKHPIFVYNV